MGFLKIVPEQERMQSTPSKRYQQLQPEDRVTLASLAQQKYSVRAMALPPCSTPTTSAYLAAKGKTGAVGSQTW
jgi:hypothetical protein